MDFGVGGLRGNSRDSPYQSGVGRRNDDIELFPGDVFARGDTHICSGNWDCLHAVIVAAVNSTPLGCFVFRTSSPLSQTISSQCNVPRGFLPPEQARPLPLIKWVRTNHNKCPSAREHSISPTGTSSKHPGRTTPRNESARGGRFGRSSTYNTMVKAQKGRNNNSLSAF